MNITLEVPGIILYTLLGWHPPEDPAEVIGLSTVAYLSAKDPGHVFLPAARLHDALYANIGNAQSEMCRWEADARFLEAMLAIAQQDVKLQEEACTLYMLVRKYYHGTAWKGLE